MSMSRRPVRLIEAFRTLEGDGFEVRRAVPTADAEAVGPFIFLDHFGPIDLGPGEALGASVHPHAGIETLSLLLEGRMRHMDSIGNTSDMSPGDVQWMRAGRGIVHDENPDEEFKAHGGRLHGVQLWLNMPKAAKLDPPAYRHVARDSFPVVTGSNARARLVMGDASGARGPIETGGAPVLLHASLDPGGAVEFDLPEAAELGLYVMTGSVSAGDVTVEAGRIALLSDGDVLRLESAKGAEALVLGGDPLDAPIVRHGPFVANSVDDMRRTIERYRGGEMGTIATGNQGRA